MKRFMAMFSLLLAIVLAFGPLAVGIADAHGSGSGGSGSGSSGGSGASASGGSSGASASGGGAAGSAGGASGGSAAGAASGAAAGPADASGGVGGSGSPSNSGSPSASPAIGNPSTRPAAVMTSPSASVAGTYVGRRTLTGEVTTIDNANGTFTLKTADAGTLNLQASPSAVAGVKRGDTIVVEIPVQ